jgi:hypothetical protein
VGVGDHCETKRVGHALAVRPAVVGEPEHRLDQRLELQRRADLGPEARVGLARVPELVRRTGIDAERLTRLCHDRLLAGLERDLALEDLERLGLVRVHVGGRNGAVGLDDDLDEDVLASRVGRCLDEANDLAGHGVVQGVSGANHRCLLGPNGCDQLATIVAPSSPLRIGREDDFARSPGRCGSRPRERDAGRSTGR